MLFLAKYAKICRIGGNMSFKTTHDSKIKSFFAGIYAYFGLNLLFAGGISYYVSNNLHKFAFLYPQGSLSMLVYCLGLTLLLSTIQSALLDKESSWTVIIPLLAIFLTIEGLLFAPFLFYYSLSDLTVAASIAGGLLLSMSLLGIYTSIDLSQYNQIVTLGAVAIFIAEFLAIFVLNLPINMQLTSIGMIICFLFFTANEMQKLKSLYFQNSYISLNKLSVLGSLLLFINFVAILQRLLVILGEKRKKN